MRPVAGRASSGLSEVQLKEIATELESGGRAPKVALRESSAGLPAGTVGPVVRLDDPAKSDEFVVVRLNNDDLPFTPAELVVAPPKAKRAKPAADRPGQARTTPAPGSGPGSGPDSGSGSAVPAPAPAASAPPAAAATAPVAAPATGQVPVRAGASAAPVQAAVTGRTESGGTRASAQVEPSAAVRPSPRAESGGGRKQGSKRQVPKLTVSLHYDERGWTVEASRGARNVLKPTPVRPAAALQMAQLLDNEQVAQAIEDIAHAEREEAERRAAELRAQLAEVEAVLAGYDEA